VFLRRRWSSWRVAENLKNLIRSPWEPLCLDLLKTFLAHITQMLSALLCDEQIRFSVLGFAKASTREGRPK
jgi:hypothetical protein